MKYLMIVLFLMSNVSTASDPVCTELNDPNHSTESTESMEIKTDVPNHLKGAVIIVRRADGKESIVPAEKFKVVPRKQQFIVTKVSKSRVFSCVSNEARKNRVSLLGGHGAQSGLNSSTNGSTATVESNVGLVGGAQYQRMISERWSLGVQGQTNKTGSVLLGLDF